MGLVTKKRYIGGDGSYLVSISSDDEDDWKTVRVGVDIGQTKDHTAIVVTEELPQPKGADQYAVRSIERIPLGTSFPAIADRIAQVVFNLKKMSLERIDAGQTGFYIELLIDATGVGRPVIDLVMQKDLSPIAVTLTGGDALTEHEGDRVSMAKSWMVARMQVLLQSDRLILPDTPEGNLLKRELADYQCDYTSAGNLTFNARSAAHDDLVIALGLSTGTGKQRPLPVPFIFGKVKGRW